MGIALTALNKAFILLALFCVLLFLFKLIFPLSDTRLKAAINVTLFLILGIILALLSTSFSGGNYYRVKCTGRVASDIDKGIVIEDVYVNNKSIKGKTLVYVDDAVEEGNFIEFTADLIKTSPVTSYGVNHLSVKYDIAYAAENVNNIKTAFGEKRFDEKIRSFYKSILFSNCSYSSAALSYAMLFGDTSFMEEEILNAYRASGIAHLFAVSGLHIGVLYGVLKWLTAKLRLNKILSAVIISLTLLGYSYVCGNTPSALRAAVMAIVAAFADAAYLHNDKITTVSIAAIIVALYSPLSVLTAGFMLSFAAVLSITMLSRSMRKLKLFKRSEKAAFIAAAQIGSAPLLSHFFGYVSVFGFLLNFLLAPVLSATYVYSLVVTPLTSLIKINFLFLSDLLLTVSTFIVSLAAMPTYSVINVSLSVYACVAYYAVCVLSSGYVFLKEKTLSWLKWAFGALTAALIYL